MTILILFFFKYQQKKRIGFYELSFCFFYFNYIPCIPTSIPHIPTPIPRIPTLILRNPTPFPRIPTPIPCILTLTPRIAILIPHIPILIPRIPIIFLIPFPDSPFQLLQIAKINRLINKVVNVISLVTHCLTFSRLHIIFRRH